MVKFNISNDGRHISKRKFHLGLSSDVYVRNQCIISGADPGFEKGGVAGGSWALPKDFLGQFRGLFKEFGAKRGGRATPAPLWIRA